MTSRQGAGASGDVGRPVPVHASGPAEAVKDCIICGLPYEWHDHHPDRWLDCPSREKLVGIEAELEEKLVLVTAALRARQPRPSEGKGTANAN